MAATDSGYGIAITFSSGFFAEILNVDWSGMSREAIDTSHATTTNGWMTFIPAGLQDPGELSVEINFDPDDTPPIDGAAETVTVTFPTPVGGMTGATWAASGFMTSFEPSAPIDDRMTATSSIKFSGAVTFTDAT